MPKDVRKRIMPKDVEIQKINVNATSTDLYLNTETDLTSDYDFSRDQYHNLVTKGNDALDELLAVAKESEPARAYEVAAMLIRNLSDTTKELLQLQKTKKEIEKDVKDPHTVNNSLFIGSTKELQDLLLENKKNGK